MSSPSSWFIITSISCFSGAFFAILCIVSAVTSSIISCVGSISALRGDDGEAEGDGEGGVEGGDREEEGKEEPSVLLVICAILLLVGAILLEDGVL